MQMLTDRVCALVSLQATVENCLVMALIWGVGGTVDEQGRVLFSQCLRGFLKGEAEELT